MKFKSAFMLLLTATCLHANAIREGAEGGGGGDPCENRIKMIANDLVTWFEKGGAAALKLPSHIDLNSYLSHMTNAISIAKVNCVGPGDKGHPVQVNGTAKICRYDYNKSAARITCDFSKFQEMNESDQYVLVHHEYAGIAGVEVPDKDNSRYDISNQITDYLTDHIVKKLTVISTPPTGPTKDLATLILTTSTEYKISPYKANQYLQVEICNPNCRGLGTDIEGKQLSTNETLLFRAGTYRIGFYGMPKMKIQLRSGENKIIHLVSGILPKQHGTVVARAIPNLDDYNTADAILNEINYFKTTDLYPIDWNELISPNYKRDGIEYHEFCLALQKIAKRYPKEAASCRQALNQKKMSPDLYRQVFAYKKSSSMTVSRLFRVPTQTFTMCSNPDKVARMRAYLVSHPGEFILQSGANENDGLICSAYKIAMVESELGAYDILEGQRSLFTPGQYFVRISNESGGYSYKNLSIEEKSEDFEINP